MRRPALLVAAVALLATIGSTSASATAHPDQVGQMRACTTGQLRCGAIVVTRGGRVLRAATPAALPAGFGPADYHKAYVLPATAATVRTVAIVDAYDDATIYNDLTAYSTTFGLPVLPRCGSGVTGACFKKTNLGAAAGSAVSHGWDIEIALDVETVHAICQNCKIVLVEARSPTFANIATAENTAAHAAAVVSNSFYSYELDGAIGNPSDAAFDHPKKAIVVSAGDNGYGVGYPATLNTVVAVGGTRLTLNATGGYGSERAWGPDGTHAWGTGSGCSTGAVGHSMGVLPEPARPFQTTAAGWAGTHCGRFRGDNDVAANADPNSGSAVYVGSKGAFIQVGGTSLAAPLIAAVFALKGNAGTTSYPASLLYAKLGTSSFHDVQTGTDDAGNWPLACPAGTTQCIAKPGYDLPTGVGTPRGLGGF
jgi:hypothetical protein